MCLSVRYLAQITFHFRTWSLPSQFGHGVTPGTVSNHDVAVCGGMVMSGAPDEGRSMYVSSLRAAHLVAMPGHCHTIPHVSWSSTSHAA
jgi:hypothetical protein